MLAGNLRKGLEKDNERVVQMMDNLEQEKILLEIQASWSIGQDVASPIKKPNTTPRQLGENAEEQNLQVEQHQHVDKSKNKPVGGQKSDWFTHLTGLVGWWRRIETMQSKLEEKERNTG